MLRYTKWEDWSFTITNSVQCLIWVIVRTRSLEKNPLHTEVDPGKLNERTLYRIRPLYTDTESLQYNTKV